jgi:hypothetical protein
MTWLQQGAEKCSRSVSTHSELNIKEDKLWRLYSEEDRKAATDDNIQFKQENEVLWIRLDI